MHRGACGGDTGVLHVCTPSGLLREAWELKQPFKQEGGEIVARSHVMESTWAPAPFHWSAGLPHAHQLGALEDINFAEPQFL